jgi:hypothetical protein
VEPDRTIAENLRDLLLGAADDLSTGLTPDPAGVSDPIKLPDGVASSAAVKRLRELGEAVADAVEHADDLDQAEASLAEAYPDFIESDSGTRQLGAALILGNTARIRRAFGQGADQLKPSRTYGDETR